MVTVTDPLDDAPRFHGSEYMSLPEFMTVAEVAAWLRIGRAAVYGAIERRELVARRFGRILRVRRRDVERWFYRGAPDELTVIMQFNQDPGWDYWVDLENKRKRHAMRFRRRYQDDRKIIRIDNISRAMWVSRLWPTSTRSILGGPTTPEPLPIKDLYRAYRMQRRPKRLPLL